MLSDHAIQTLNREMIDAELITPDRLYLDWSLFRDPYLGAVISLLASAPDQTQSAEKFAYLQACLPAYQNRCFHDVAHAMPKLGMTTSQILDRLADPTKHVEIFFAAPFTCFIQVLYANLQVNINHSAVRGKFKKIYLDDKHHMRDYDPIRLSINTYPLVLSKRQHDLIGAFFTGNYAVDVEILSTDPKDLPLDFLLTMDELYTDHLPRLLDNTAFSQALSDMKFASKRLFAVKHLGPQRPPALKDRVIEAEFLRLQAVMDMMCQFTWLSSKLLAYDLHPPVDPKERGA